MAASKKIILITGTNSGIGYEASFVIANASPDNHVIMTSRSPAKGQKALEEIQARKPQGTVSYLELDVANSDTIDAAVKHIEKEFGVLDVLLNNAGIVFTKAQERRASILETFDINTVGPLLLSEALLPLLKKSKDPRVIFVSSGLGSITMRKDPSIFGYDLGAEAYRMSKSAMNMAAINLYELHKTWGLKVWTACPGYVVTNLTGEGDRENRANQGAMTPEQSALGLLKMVDGRRDEHVGLFTNHEQGKNGVYGW